MAIILRVKLIIKHVRISPPYIQSALRTTFEVNSVFLMHQRPTIMRLELIDKHVKVSQSDTRLPTPIQWYTISKQNGTEYGPFITNFVIRIHNITQMCRRFKHWHLIEYVRSKNKSMQDEHVTKPICPLIISNVDIISHATTHVCTSTTKFIYTLTVNNSVEIITYGTSRPPREV